MNTVTFAEVESKIIEIRGQQVIIDSDVAEGPQSVILQQVENGVFMRMAILESLVV